jgi:Molecular chaperone, HSP90 family
MEIVKASPTKDFFITMLTRDVPLDRAILDLIDNSIDAAHKSGELKNKVIEVELNKDHFCIKDNCGGIDKEDAKEYAFKFGRSREDDRETPGSVGQFGVGMKRTLFKIGKEFTVESAHPAGSFVVDVDVEKWFSNKDWEFTLEEEQLDGEYGTKITVKSLYDGVSDQFQLDTFTNDLREDVKKAHFKAISEGVTIKVNDTAVEKYQIKVKSSEELSPINYKVNIDGVECRVVAGVSDRDYNAGGWYIICNGRLVQEANTDYKTGWGVDGLRKYHPDFAYFRGVVELESKDSSKLPWTTTKTGVDTDNKIYRRLSVEMRKAMREVMSFLTDRKKEVEDFKMGLIEDTPLDNSIEESNNCDVFVLKENESFIRLESQVRKKQNPLVSVQYKVEKSRIEKVKKRLEVASYSEAGKQTFDYYCEYEMSDE